MHLETTNFHGRDGGGVPLRALRMRSLSVNLADESKIRSDFDVLNCVFRSNSCLSLVFCVSGNVGKQHVGVCWTVVLSAFDFLSA